MRNCGRVCSPMARCWSFVDVHYMQQETDSPNRDRKPDKPKEPTMIYIVEARQK